MCSIRKSKFIFFFLAILSLFFVLEGAAALDCLQYIGTCKIPAGAQIYSNDKPYCIGIKPGSSEMKCADFSRAKHATKILPNGKWLHYSSLFQCNSDGKVLLQEGAVRKVRHDSENYDLMGGLITDKFYCLLNCCYSFDEKAVFVGEMHGSKGCRNRCCPTFAGYVAGDCSIGAGDVAGGGKNPPSSDPGDIVINPGDVELFPQSKSNSNAKTPKNENAPQIPNLGGMDFNF